MPKPTEVNGKYLVFYKSPFAQSERHRNAEQIKLHKFEGNCEFWSTKMCVFSNENKEILVVDFNDVVQMRLVK